MDASIRKIREEDIEGYYQALASVAREGRYILTVEPPPIKRLATFVTSNIEKGHPGFVCEFDGKIIGWADITPNPRQNMEHSGGLGMGVLKPFRGQGLGKRLLSAVLADAWKFGLVRIELEVFTDNIPAIALYQSMGFEMEGIKRKARFYNDAYQDIALMAQCRQDS